MILTERRRKSSRVMKRDIVHEFCHKYRDGMDVDNLLLEIVNSYGIEYNQGLEEEIRPSCNNYMKIHRED